ncbi:MAG: hypothetical protein O6930_01155 [Gammaproteobacteria bacterium]|nr:hypothetical protein [Gammaproteobacteria bacterium]
MKCLASPEAVEPNEVERVVDAPVDLGRCKSIVLKRKPDFLLDRQGYDLIFRILKQHVDQSEPVGCLEFAAIDQSTVGVFDQHPSLIPSAEVIGVNSDEIQGERALSRAAATQNEYE